MNRQALPAVPGVLHNVGMPHVSHLLNHVEFAQAVNPFFFGGQQRQRFAVFVLQVANRA